MANVFTAYAQSQLDAKLTPSGIPSVATYGGTVRSQDVPKASYTASTSDPVFIMQLPKGARLLPNLCSVTTADPGDALTGTVGYFTTAETPVVIDVNAFGTVTLGSAAGTVPFVGSTEAWLSGITFDQDVWIVVTWGTATTPVAHAENWHMVYTLG